MKFFSLLIGGALGTVFRAYISSFFNTILGIAFPYGTFVVNLFGCFLLGFLVVISETRYPATIYGKILMTAGFCGAFTTFSTFILETSLYARRGHEVVAFLNVLLSVILGYVLLRLGMFFGNKF